jgi:hypothetical protein
MSPPQGAVMDMILGSIANAVVRAAPRGSAARMVRQMEAARSAREENTRVLGVLDALLADLGGALQ